MMQNTALRDDFEHSGADLPDPGKPDLITVEEAKALDAATMADLFKEHINPGQFHFMKLLGFHKVKIETAQGMYYVDQNGRKILDFFGGFGSVAHGHNDPRVIAARQKFPMAQEPCRLRWPRPKRPDRLGCTCRASTASSAPTAIPWSSCAPNSDSP